MERNQLLVGGTSYSVVASCSSAPDLSNGDLHFVGTRVAAKMNMYRQICSMRRLSDAMASTIYSLTTARCPPTSAWMLCRATHVSGPSSIPPRNWAPSHPRVHMSHYPGRPAKPSVVVSGSLRRKQRCAVHAVVYLGCSG